MTKSKSSPTPSISSSAMLVSANFKMLGVFRKDIEATDHVNSHYESKGEVASVTKQLFSPRHLKHIKSVRTSIGEYIWRHTLPWSEDGKRLLPADIFDDFQAKMEDFKHQWRVEVDDFMRRWDDMMYEAASEAGKMFDKNDYPSAEDAKKKFGFSISFMKVPDKKDFRIDIISKAAQAKIRKDIEAQVQGEVVAGKREILERIQYNMQHLASVLSDDKKQFRKSALQNAKEMSKLLKGLNITNDPAITDLEKTTTKMLDTLDADELLEKGKDEQKKAAEKVNESLGKIEQTASAIFG